ncbi:hypothetical protein A2U01_0067223, partial [Trifolium medium]|nr:hypothetical protein [Trifolium medium]
VSASVIDTIYATGADFDITVNALQQHSRRPAIATALPRVSASVTDHLCD